MIKSPDSSPPPPAKKAKTGLAAFGFSTSISSTSISSTSISFTGTSSAAKTSSSLFKSTTKAQVKPVASSTFKSNTKSRAKPAAAANTVLPDDLPQGALPPLKTGELMHSTKPASASKRSWVRHAPNKNRDITRSYCSTDGSATGWHGAVFVANNSSVARVRATWKDCQGSRNVGAEAYGFALGVGILAVDCADCVFLADFLNALAWDVGGAKYKHSAIVDAFDGKEGVKATRKRNGHGPSNSTWDHVHHPGHQTDTSWFTMLNQVADNLASTQVDVDITVPLEVLRELTVQGKTAVDKCKEIFERYTEAEETAGKESGAHKSVPTM